MSGAAGTAGVIATYNQAAFIREAVASLVGQVDELVVVDDASSDGTAAALELLEYPNLRVIRNAERSGVSISFNNAVEATTADVLFIQGGDDRSSPDRVERQLKSLDAAGTILSASVPLVMNETGSPLPAWAASEFHPADGPFDTLVQLFSLGNMICAPSAALRRSDYLAHGGFHIGLDHLQDYRLWLKLAESGRFDILADPVVAYRKHSSNLSRDYVGIDSPMLRRKRAELDYILKEFLDSATGASLQRLAEGNGMDSSAFEAMERGEQAAVLQLSHHDRLQVRHGLAFVLQKLGEGGAQGMLDRMGLTLGDVDRLAIKADHDNSETVARALAVRAQHDELTTRRGPRKKRGTK